MLTGSSDSLAWLISGAGDADLPVVGASTRALGFVAGKVAPQISQMRKEG